MLSYRMWFRVLWLKIFRVSEEHATSIFSVEILGRTTKDVAYLSGFAGFGGCRRCVEGTPHWGIRCGNLQSRVQEYRLVHLAMDIVQKCTLKVHNCVFYCQQVVTCRWLFLCTTKTYRDKRLWRTLRDALILTPLSDLLKSENSGRRNYWDCSVVTGVP